MIGKTSFILIAIGLFAISQCSTVTQLTIKNYDSVLTSKEGWLIEFYSKMCGTCQEFEPTWHTVIKDIKNLKIGRVDIDNKDGMALAQKLDILNDGIPNVSLVYKKDVYDTIMTGSGELLNEVQLKKKIDASISKHLILNKESGMFYKSDL